MASWESAVCTVNGIELHYLRTGGGRPPVILLHGLTGSGACWSPLAHALEADFDVIMPDARGHGASSAPPSGYRYEDHAGDVIGLIHALGLDTPVLLGHSMGGMTAAVVAAQIGAGPGKLILADPTFLSPQRQREVFESDAVEQHRRLLSLDRDEALAEALARHPQRSREVVELVTEARLSTPIRAFAVLTPPNPEYRRLVSAIDAPTLLVIADHGVVSGETARELQEIKPGLRVERIEDAGHGLPYDQPERFEAAVRSFLG